MFVCRGIPVARARLDPKPLDSVVSDGRVRSTTRSPVPTTRQQVAFCAWIACSTMAAWLSKRNLARQSPLPVDSAGADVAGGEEIGGGR